jgi:hypothetical protein
MPTKRDIVKIAKVSQYLVENDIGNGGLYGKGIDLQLPKKIYCVRKNLEKVLTDPDTTYTNAVGYITINDVGQVGDTISVYVNDPVLGILLLGSYEVTVLDTNVNTLAENIANALGSTIHLPCNVKYITTEASDRITTESSNKLTTEN